MIQMQYSKFLDFLETMAQETGKRSICEAIAELATISSANPYGSILDYSGMVGSAINKIVRSGKEPVGDWSINKALRQKWREVVTSYENNVAPEEIAQVIYDIALTYVPKRYVNTVDFHPLDVKPVAAEGIMDTARTIKDYVRDKAIPIAVGAAIGTGAAVTAPKAVDAFNDVRNDVKEQVVKANEDSETTMKAGQWNMSGHVLENHGWKYVDFKDKPGIYGPHYRGLPLDELDGMQNPLDHEPIKVGWYVSPDGHKVFSTVTGKYFNVEKDFNDPSFTKGDLGEHAGVGLRYILPEDECNQWDLEAYYGKGNI